MATSDDRNPSDAAARKPIHEIQQSSLEALAQAANERERFGHVTADTQERLRATALAYYWALRPYRGTVGDQWDEQGLDQLLQLSRETTTVTESGPGRGDAGTQTRQRSRLSQCSAAELEMWHDRLWTVAVDELGFGAEVEVDAGGIDADPF